MKQKRMNNSYIMLLHLPYDLRTW